MKNVNVIDIKPNTNITDFFMIKATSIKVGSNGKEYQDVMLTDATGDLSAKKWDVDENNIEFLKSLKVGDLVKVRGSVTDWKGQTQLRINQIRLATEEDDLEMSDFVKSAPEKPIDMYDTLSVRSTLCRMRISRSYVYIYMRAIKRNSCTIQRRCPTITLSTAVCSITSSA